MKIAIVGSRGYTNKRKIKDFIFKLKEKVAKNSGEWSNKVKLAAIIQWKKAYESSQVNTLDAFMT